MGKTIPLPNNRAYERIKRDIITCAIAPGTQLFETQLCAQHKLDKALVRIALTRLAHEGLVRSIPKRGYVVAPVTLKDIHDAFELCLMLEPAAARMAAGRAEAHRLRALDDAYRTGYQPGDPTSVARFLDADKAFRIAVARAAGNSRLADVIEHVLDGMTRLLHLALNLRNCSRDMQRERRSLMKALIAGDAGAAERICRDQIDAARNMVLSAILTGVSPLNPMIPADHR